MGESKVLSGRGCLRVNGDGSLLLICTAESCGKGMAMVRGKVGNSIVGCGEGGGVQRFKWLVMAALMILMAVSSVAVMEGEAEGVDMIVVDEGDVHLLCF